MRLSVVIATNKTAMVAKVQLLLALPSIFIALVSACPGEYQPVVGGRCMRSAEPQLRHSLQRQDCQKDGGDLISIHSAEENDAIRKNVSEEFVNIGLACDHTRRKFYWLDGTPFDFSYITAHCTSSNIVVVLRKSDGFWLTTTYSIYYGICGLPGHNNVACNDYDHVEYTQSCVALRSNKLSWRDAEKSCESENAHLLSIHDYRTNDFVGAKAPELGLLYGLHIGLETNVSKGEQLWTDGSNFTFNNFAKRFPNDFFGHCTVLETQSRVHEWVTNSCDDSQLPFACSRTAYDIYNPLARDGCPENPYYFTSGTIYSPSYPRPQNSTTTGCDYFLIVGEGKKVQVTFDDVDLNTCCDKVELYEGHLGDTFIAKLTGEPQAGQTFNTSTSNVMRLSLTMSDGRFIRGFRAHFVTIDDSGSTLRPSTFPNPL